jgi:hypothetical protein
MLVGWRTDHAARTLPAELTGPHLASPDQV